MDELMEAGLDEILFKILEREYMWNETSEIRLITAQLNVLNYLLLENSGMVEKGLETKLEWFRNDLIRQRDMLLSEDIIKRMPNVQRVWTALRDR
ncbi:hypothetical protein P7D98_22685 [Enterococcus avium]|uniref:hypothetical protein n=1 Tax=Enterococcus avium TaxID=33945 RepID=UPI00288F6CD3|nr:hypothetical protein [Enterococcus avium]MDT2468446.1 hypothetical protein [Enterococcus avium]MDT2507870.1 hypothetical protein [Enterococcus avium]